MRDSLFIAVVGLMLSGCRGEYASDAPRVRTGGAIMTAPAADVRDGVPVDTLLLDTTASEVAWAGTKMWGRGGHTGVVAVQSGWIARSGDLLTGGHIIVDMTSIGVTDIPPDQPEPISLLTRHLKDPLFFHVEKYPQASFRLLSSERVGDRVLLVYGFLTIRGVTRPVRVPVEIDRSRSAYDARFRIDRFDWNVAYEGGFGATRFAARNFVDREIELDIRLKLMP